MEEAELERLRAVEAVRSKYEERFLQQVQELQRQVRDLQSSVKVTTSGGNGSHTRPLTEDTAKPSDSEFTDQQTIVSVGTACTTDKVDGPDSTGSTGHACGETNEVTLSQQSGALSEALMAQQLPLPSKFSGSDIPSEETFEEWITHFELVAGVHKWNAQAKLIHLITRLRGEAFNFYRSCSKQQKSSYELLVKELTRRFTPVRIQSVQTSLFHDRKQGDHESVDKYAQDLKSHFHKAYPQSQQGNEVAETMGKAVLASQFVAGLIPALKAKVAGAEGGFEELLVKARFEEAKLRDLRPTKKQSESPARPPQQSGERRPLLECSKCGGTNHTAKYCRFRGRAEPVEARGRGNSRDGNVRALVPPKGKEQKKAELYKALTDIVTTICTPLLHRREVDSLMSEVQLEGSVVNALLDTGSPVSIVSLEFLLEALAKKRKQEESPQQWRARVEKRLQEPPGALLRSFGGETLDLMCQVTVNIARDNQNVTASVLVQKGAPLKLLLGSDLLPRLGFSFLETKADDSTVDHLQPQPTSPQTMSATVWLLTATRLPPRHTKIIRARVDGSGHRSTSLLVPEVQ